MNVKERRAGGPEKKKKKFNYYFLKLRGEVALFVCVCIVKSDDYWSKGTASSVFVITGLSFSPLKFLLLNSKVHFLSF